MRTVPAIIIIVVLLLGGSLATYQYLHTTSQALVTQIEGLEKSIATQKWEVAQKELNTVLQRWGKTKNWWTILLDHQEIDNIDVSINRLEKYIQTQDLPLSLGEVSVLEMLVDHISETEQLNLRNIL